MNRMRTSCALLMIATIWPAVGAAQQLELTRVDKKTTVVSRPPSVIAGKALTVLCGAFDCSEVHAKVVPGEVLLSPSAGLEKAGQRTFELPEAKDGSKLQLWACAGVPVVTCMSSPPLVEIPFGEPPATSQPAARATVVEFCSKIGAVQFDEIRSRRGGRADFTVVVFDHTGPCFLSRQFGAEGDPIAIGFVSATPDTVSLDLDPCNTLAAAPKVLISADVSTLTFQAATEGQLRAEWFPPLRRCFGTAAGIKLVVTKAGENQPKTIAHTLKQFERYRATLQIGVAASDLHQQTFSLRQSGAAKRIIETTADERGPEYTAAVVLYGVPHYFARRRVQSPCFYGTLGSLETREKAASPVEKTCPTEPDANETYFGRDPVNDNSAIDRVGLMFAAGINQPGRRFLVGASFEVLTGVNLFVAREFVRLPELVELAVGDEFSGEASAIPTRDHWRQAWTGGVSIDARYALALFGRK